jgi:hypothetical protein
MKTKLLILSFLLSFMVFNSYSQEKSKKQLKAERKIEKQKQITALIDSKSFVFEARMALPSGMRSVNLSPPTNYMKFEPELIDSQLPFFGRGYSAIGYGGSDTGMKFSGKPEIFTIEKKENSFQIEAEVKTSNDNFKIILSVGSTGSASLSITSNNRSSISYNGEIVGIKQPEKK